MQDIFFPPKCSARYFFLFSFLCRIFLSATWNYFSDVRHKQRVVVFRDLLIFPLSRSVADQRRQRSFADISTLDSLGQRLINSAYADSNQRNLHSHIKSYLFFCDFASVVRFPVTVTLNTSYAAYQVSLGRAYRTILNHLSSLKHMHKLLGHALTWDSDYR